MTEKITSRENPLIVNAVKLVSSAKHRQEQGLFFAEGMRLCTDAAVSGIAVEQFFYTAEAEQKYASSTAQLKQKAKLSFEITNALAQKLSDTKTPQGIFCVCRMPKNTADMASPANHFSRWIALESIQDPSNMGTILRTAEALGVDGAIFIGDCCDIYSPKVLRGSMGAVFRLPVYREDNSERLFLQLKKQNYATLAAVPRDGAVSVTDAKKMNAFTADKRGVVMFVGNEGNGLTDGVIAACESAVTIPMHGRAESLNAAVAASILMWEMVRELSHNSSDE